MIVTLDGRTHPPDAPLLYADDLAALRGDGVFETLLVRNGRACLVEAHLRRLAGSAELMDLPAPDLAAWREAIAVAVRHWPGPAEAILRLIYSRGRENGADPTCYVLLTALPDRIRDTRANGVAAITLQRGLPTGAESWLLAGAKTLSYGVNMAALRHAARRGADDVIFVGPDGTVLEGPRSTVVIAQPDDDGVRLLTPPHSQPILEGTTQRALFALAGTDSSDFSACEYRSLQVADLLAADGVWLVSSVTLAARVHTLNGTRLATPTLGRQFDDLVVAAVTS
ncbi:aminodeoxychorismate lyase [Mycolicibacillus parakoreensis]|uniref:Aminodeoxychorismate lyase n=1 Tax=Mycolicibacillus parakoreensis TaxID=1069221 RepID=A0ABY3UAD6_9MYCO|nr:aminodeoxychorismate lyase [Mycolicibacillus parakoreensis]MCV7314337.1 aminodeoxychorismate lyase [Mycolicibacillus parakoreensis]ULN54433.1 aminodeoxychorismate lyase [Mycolicibacillus parakoreensis]HLR99629.1 aminodeoxychorismate lyase [Mycolicibacillus parakoreensis]